MADRHMTIYFASPFLNSEQVEREEYLKETLRALGYDVWSPKESCFLPPNTTEEERKQVFMSNCQAIIKSDIVFVVTDGKDVGTIWEAGYAFANGTPVVYFCETLPKDGQFNLMLAVSGNLVIQDRKYFHDNPMFAIHKDFTNVFHGERIVYKGAIE